MRPEEMGSNRWKSKYFRLILIYAAFAGISEYIGFIFIDTNRVVALSMFALGIFFVIASKGTFKKLELKFPNMVIEDDNNSTKKIATLENSIKTENDNPILWNKFKWFSLSLILFILSSLTILTMMQCDFYRISDAGPNIYKLIPIAILILILVPSMIAGPLQLAKILGFEKGAKINTLKAYGLVSSLVILFVFFIINLISKQLCN